MWDTDYKYIWNKNSVSKLKDIINDEISHEYRQNYLNSIINLEKLDDVAEHFNNFISQACQRALRIKKSSKQRKYKIKQTKWYDKECALRRSEAVRAGERVENEADKIRCDQLCKAYRACKQRKKRQFRQHCQNKIDQTFKTNPSNIWNVIDDINKRNKVHSEPSAKEFLKHFTDLSKPQYSPDFNYQYEFEAKEFLQNYDNGSINDILADPLEYEILNSNFTVEEILKSIESLKKGKSTGCDKIPAEFIQCCKDNLVNDITNILNYAIEKREFPQSWTQGVRSPIYKNGDRKNANNYRGITVLPIFEKIFEITIYNRLQFVNEAFCKTDELNGGFLKGRRTSDNIFILNGLIKRQLLLGKSLYVCFVDFSKAFDLINRHILFNKLVQSGWHGKIMDTLRNLYKKIHFRLKQDGKLGPSIFDRMGVNQGGNASGFLFRKYMADLSSYLKDEFGVIIDDMILGHLLWADDLILFSDTLAGIKRQLHGLKKFCVNNHMIVNSIKTKIMKFGTAEKIDIIFNDAPLEQVQQYKYVGCVIRSISKSNADPFLIHYDYLHDQARKALFAAMGKLKHIGKLPPKIMFYLFNTVAKPILTYASDVWGANASGQDMVDKVFLRFIKRTLGVRQNISNLMVIGETGLVPPSIDCKLNIIKYHNRVIHMDRSTLIRKVYDELARLQRCGFNTWCGKTWELLKTYDLKPNSHLDVFKKESKMKIYNSYIHNYLANISDTNSNPITRTYVLYKSTFGIEPYLELIKNYKYRQAFSKIRTSSHSLNIETGRHGKNKCPVNERLCTLCHTIEDEPHFIITCPRYSEERKYMYDACFLNDDLFFQLSEIEKFTYIMSSQSQNHLYHISKFVFLALNKRQEILNIDVDP